MERGQGDKGLRGCVKGDNMAIRPRIRLNRSVTLDYVEESVERGLVDASSQFHS